MNKLKENTFKVDSDFLENFKTEQLRLIEIAHSYYDGRYSPLKNGGVHVKYDKNEEAGFIHQETLVFDGYLRIFKVEKEIKFLISEDITEFSREWFLIMTEEEYQKWGNFGLKYEYNLLSQKYIDIFMRKHQLNKSELVDEIVRIYMFDDKYMFNFNDIKLDIDTNQDVNLITSWFFETKNKNPLENYISYESYIKGERYV